jgi:hypothetical protein
MSHGHSKINGRAIHYVSIIINDYVLIMVYYTIIPWILLKKQQLIYIYNAIKKKHVNKMIDQVGFYLSNYVIVGFVDGDTQKVP